MECISEKLKNLKCVSCNNYLSVPPIFINMFSENFCGRCYPKLENESDKFFIRNKTFEDLGASFLFPCKYQPDGCKLKLTMETMKAHELNCKFQEKMYFCPLENNNNGCKWCGALNDIEEHFKKYHPKNVANHPLQKIPDTTKKYEKNIITTVDGFIFVINFISNPDDDQVSFTTFLMDHPSLTKLFSWSILIFDEANTVMKSSDVLPYKANEISKHGIKFFISYLKKDFGNFENFNISLRITLKEVFCSTCKILLKKSPIYPAEEKFLCGDCHLLTKSHTCKNRERGCTFKNPDYFLLRKHEYWLCKYRNSNCRWCNKKLENISKLEHYENRHDIIVKAEMSNNNAITTFNLSMRSYSYIINAHDMKFRMFVNFSKHYFHISVLTNSIEKGADFFLVFYLLTRGDNCINGKLRKRTSESLNNYWLVTDWHENIFLQQTFIDKPTKNNDIKLELNIMKNFIC